MLKIFRNNNLSITEKEAVDALHNWAHAVGMGTSTEVVKLYKTDALLLPTFAGPAEANGDKPLMRNTPELRDAYFVQFTAKENLKCKFVSCPHITLSGSVASVAGLYDFSFTKDGQPQKVSARYGFTFEKRPEGVKITQHHSSVVPS